MTDLHTQRTQQLRHGGTGLTTQDPTARFAGALLRRHVETRDRSCVFPGCRATAQSADLDHTIDQDHGGPTSTSNSGPLCRHDHRLKHPGRWRLHQPTPRHFTWTSPLDRTYHTQPPPITHELPQPQPRPDDPSPWPFAARFNFVSFNDDPPILDRPPPPPDPPPAPPDPDQPPPF
ncbi:MAG TPA: HNH endonuclease signature motif containing protein [Pseudonocardiaceae bacterium]|nr:HNH endonuclease signature motif containing protein [Pseudonocardiaceae bacterium]